MKCYKCKKRINNESKFCEYCGAKVERILHDYMKKIEDVEHVNEGIIMLCPNCGNRVDNEKKYTVLRIKCAEKKTHWILMNYFVYLDNKIIGILHDDSYFIYHVPNGNHKLLIRHVHRRYFEDIFTKEIEFSDNTNSIDLFIADRKTATMSENLKKNNEPIKQTCYNCKHEILDNSNFCKYCGTNINNEIIVKKEDIIYCPKCGNGIEKKQEHAILTVKRLYHSLWGVIVYYNIILDGKILGPLANGDYISCYVSAGNHELRIEPISHLKYVKKGSISQIITINNNTNSVEIVIDAAPVQSAIITSIEYK